MTDFEDEDNEIIDVKLSVKDYKTLKAMIAKQEAMSYVKSWISNLWLWSVGTGVLTILYIWDKVHKGDF